MVIEFMAMVRKVPLKKLNPPVMMSMITRLGLNCDIEIRIVFDTYKRTASKIQNEKEEERTRK